MLRRPSSVNNFKWLLLWNYWANCNQISNVGSRGRGEWKVVKRILVTWPRWPPCAYMVKTLKNLLLQNQLTVDLWTWYVALSMRVLPRLLKLWPWVDLDPFYAKVKFGPIGICMGKSENNLFYRNCCSLRSQSCLKHSALRVNGVKWVSEVKVTKFSKFKLVFLRNNCAIWNQSSYESLRENGNENLYKWFGSHVQHGCHAHIW